MIVPRLLNSGSFLRYVPAFPRRLVSSANFNSTQQKKVYVQYCFWHTPTRLVLQPRPVILDEKDGYLISKPSKLAITFLPWKSEATSLADHFISSSVAITGLGKFLTRCPRFYFTGNLVKKGADPLDERTPIPINVEFTNEKLSFSMTIDEENCWTVYLNESETCIFLKLIDSAIPLMSGFNLISPSIPNSTNVDFMNFP